MHKLLVRGGIQFLKEQRETNKHNNNNNNNNNNKNDGAERHESGAERIRVVQHASVGTIHYLTKEGRVKTDFRAVLNKWSSKITRLVQAAGGSKEAECLEKLASLARNSAQLGHS